MSYLLRINSRDRQVGGKPSECIIPLNQPIKGQFRVHTIVMPNSAAAISEPVLSVTIGGVLTHLSISGSPAGLPVRDRYYDIDNLITDLNAQLLALASAPTHGVVFALDTHSSRLHVVKNAGIEVILHSIDDHPQSTVAPALGIHTSITLATGDLFVDTESPMSLACDLLCYNIDISEAEFGIKDTKGRNSGICVPIDENSHNTIIYRSNLHGEQYLNFPNVTHNLSITIRNERGAKISSLRGALGQDYLIILEKVSDKKRMTYSSIPSLT
jgi:hypothetical protein